MIKVILLILLAAPAGAAELYNLGKNFGREGHWQIGLDKSPTAGACALYNVADKALMAGPCRDFVLAVRKGETAAHLGYAMLFNLEDTAQARPAHTIRAGVNVGPAAKAALERLTDGIPRLEDLASYKAPAWASYLGKITTLDLAGGWRPQPGEKESRWPWGMGVKVDIPLSDLAAILKGK